MAITLVGAEAVAVSGEYPTLSSIIIPYPAGITAGDTIHLAVTMPRYRWWRAQFLTFSLVRQYGISIPVGWQLVTTDTYNPHVGHAVTGTFEQITFLLRRAAIGTETGNVVVSLTQTNHQPSVPPVDEVLHVAASIVVHSGVSLSDPYEQPPVFINAGQIAGRSTSTNSSLVQLAAAYAAATAGASFGIGDPIPEWPDPTTTTSEPAEWDVLDQVSTLAVLGTRVYADQGGNGTQVLAVRAAALGADDSTPGPFFPGDFPMVPGVMTGASRVLFALRDAGDMPPVDPPPQAGQVGATGSGSVTPEWDGRNRIIQNPLLCSIWSEGLDDEGAPEFHQLTSVEDSPQPVAADVTFNGLGACTGAVLAFAAQPGLVPYGHAVKLALLADGVTGEPDWWAGVVRNVRFDNGLFLVDLDGLWSLLNDARVQLDENGDITTPAHPVIAGTLVIGVGDPATVIVDGAAGAQQTWGDHLNDRFRITPQAAWGIGPDQVFIMGQPEQGGVQVLDAEADPAVVTTKPGEFILPPVVSEWWAQDPDGNVLMAQAYPPPALLAPARLTQSRVDELGNLVTPREADYPLISGPSHEITFAGIAIPPLQVINLPNGEAQMVASARVVINVGEEGSMPRVTTTLTTVALPFEGGP